LNQLQAALIEQQKMWGVLTLYFEDQVEEMIRFIQSSPSEDLEQSANHYLGRQGVNVKLTVLRQKFDCMGWLVRNHEFIKPSL
jgi:hypothetical protein